MILGVMEVFARLGVPAPGRALLRGPDFAGDEPTAEVKDGGRRQLFAPAEELDREVQASDGHARSFRASAAAFRSLRDSRSGVGA